MKTKEPSKHESFARDRRVVGKHSARCAREKHEDWQHGWHGCAVGKEGPKHCDCTAHWVEELSGHVEPRTPLQGYGQ